MNAKQALKKAVSLWGKTASVQDKGKPSTLPNGAILTGRFIVGRIQMGMFFSVEGDGATWEEAFANATERAAKDKARYDAIRKERSTVNS